RNLGALFAALRQKTRPGKRTRERVHDNKTLRARGWSQPSGLLPAPASWALEPPGVYTGQWPGKIMTSQAAWAASPLATHRLIAAIRAHIFIFHNRLFCRLNAGTASRHGACTRCTGSRCAAEWRLARPRKGLQRKSRKPAAGGLRNWSGKPGFFAVRRTAKKCAQILLPKNSSFLISDPLLVLPPGVQSSVSTV
ncbi:MAG: hypothetical protein LBN92_01510, partial [Treponema sp.]|nr:hypothetical protein [Treponema sp.]